MPAGQNAYNSLWQVRTDAWSALEECTAQLALAGAQQRPVEQLTDTVAEVLAVLAPIERFWAFPGMRAFFKMRRLFTTGKYDRCAAIVARINRALATDSYQGSQSWDADAEDDAYDHEARSADQGRPQRPYFEVLVVEDMTEDQERALREEFRRWRRPDDQFLYEIVVVPSFDDAVMAARLNFKLQACVVRRRFTHQSRHDYSSLAPFVSLGECEDLMDRSPHERAQVLARSLARIRPELDLYLMTEIAVEDLAGSATTSGASSTLVKAPSSSTSVSWTASRPGTARRSSAPCAATATGRPACSTRCRSRTASRSSTRTGSATCWTSTAWKSSWPRRRPPAAASTRCWSPPGRCARPSSSRPARSGPAETYFVTNGTSTANKIVVQALVQPGDIVLVDRNCHQSHHYGLMLAGAMVTYLEAYRLNQYSMKVAVPITEIKSQLLALRRAAKLDRVKMLLLTNCTFDGIVYDVQRVMQECLAIKPDLIFLWDEAWFAFARFHPVYRPRTAMRAARTLADLLRQPDYQTTTTPRPDRRDRRGGPPVAPELAAAARSSPSPGPG